MTYVPYQVRHKMSDDEMLAFAFRERPIFRQTFDAHVQDWRSVASRALWARYHSDAQFAARYNERVREAAHA